MHEHTHFAAAVIATIAIVAAGCTTLRTHSDYDSQADFTQFQTFSWAGDSALAKSQQDTDRYISPLDLQRIERAIESELVAKGLRQVGDDEPADLRVCYTVGARDKVNVSEQPAYFGRWNRQWPYPTDTVTVQTYTEGMLAIDLYDGESMLPIWHGVERKRVTGADIENSGPRIKEAVAAIFADYPPP
ncbi:MAG: DUF4136 domain-containing protein [Pseudomonadota bacterium]